MMEYRTPGNYTRNAADVKLLGSGLYFEHNIKGKKKAHRRLKEGYEGRCYVQSRDLTPDCFYCETAANAIPAAIINAPVNRFCTCQYFLLLNQYLTLLASTV